MKILYRKLGAEESKRYRALRLESIKRHPESFGSSYAEQNKLPKLMFERALEVPRDDRFIIGVFDQETLIGICGFLPFVGEEYPQLTQTGTIIQMYVKKEYGGQKIGLGLIRAAVVQAFALTDIDQIMLEVKEGNWSAIRVYEQAGFQTIRLEGSAAEINRASRIMILRREDYAYV